MSYQLRSVQQCIIQPEDWETTVKNYRAQYFYDGVKIEKNKSETRCVGYKVMKPLNGQRANGTSNRTVLWDIEENVFAPNQTLQSRSQDIKSVL